MCGSGVRAPLGGRLGGFGQQCLLRLSTCCRCWQTELNLLKKLHHQNIVEYKETIQSENALYIVLEFVENGSLAQMLKRFDCFPETLTAVYVYQVLNGLAFLHKEGVIHRDIKVSTAQFVCRVGDWHCSASTVTLVEVLVSLVT